MKRCIAAAEESFQRTFHRKLILIHHGLRYSHLRVYMMAFYLAPDDGTPPLQPLERLRINWGYTSRCFQVRPITKESNAVSLLDDVFGCLGPYTWNGCQTFFIAFIEINLGGIKTILTMNLIEWA